ncbi:MAG: biopolymer transporter ExbD [Bdellovibrionales bacterium]|nr:biopolymer transporter ExbD [Bdellovibrionales bacterium]
MAAKLDDGEGDGQISDINVTPFVDVVLVLLVIFMVTAPAMMRDALKIELPKAANVDAKTPRTFGVAITRAGQILLDGQAIAVEDLVARAREAVRENPDTQAILSADKESKHEDLVRAIDAIKSAGLNRFALEVRKEL